MRMNEMTDAYVKLDKVSKIYGTKEVKIVAVDEILSLIHIYGLYRNTAKSETQKYAENFFSGKIQSNFATYAAILYVSVCVVPSGLYEGPETTRGTSSGIA